MNVVFLDVNRLNLCSVFLYTSANCEYVLDLWYKMYTVSHIKLTTAIYIFDLNNNCPVRITLSYSLLRIIGH